MIVGGAEGKQLSDSALEDMRRSGFVNPLRDLAGYYPELMGS